MSIISACGLNCSECAAYKATQVNDGAKLTELATKWYGDKIRWRTEDLHCDGCTGQRVFPGGWDCAVRNCTREKGTIICSRCGDYPCGKLENRWKTLHGNVDDWKRNLEKAK